MGVWRVVLLCSVAACARTTWFPVPAAGLGDSAGDPATTGGDSNASDDDRSGGDPLGPAIRQLEAGGERTCVLYESGRVACWGFELSGQLGNGQTRLIGDDEPATDATFVDLSAPAVA